MAKSFTLTNARIVTPGDTLCNGIIHVEDGMITFIGKWSEFIGLQSHDRSSVVIDAHDGWVLPGFIDLHIHGGFGSDFMDATSEACAAITKYHMEHGTTAMLATLMTHSRDVLDRAIVAVDNYMKEGMNYAWLVGIHLEGPFLNPIYKGAQNATYMIDPQIHWLEDWHARFPRLIKQVSLAPERNDALAMIRWLRGHAINAALAHTAATYDQVTNAAHAGLNQSGHTFNAMTPFHHRNPGALGAVLTDDRITAEVISDGIHVHPAAIQLLLRCKPADKLILITDAISAAGMPDGHYHLVDLTITMQNGICRLTENHSLAGSTLTMLQAFINTMGFGDLTVPEASQLASLNPAKQLGIDHITGSIEVGKQADLVWTDLDMNIQRVWVQGNTHM